MSDERLALMCIGAAIAFGMFLGGMLVATMYDGAVRELHAQRAAAANAVPGR